MTCRHQLDVRYLFARCHIDSLDRLNATRVADGGCIKLPFN